MLLMPALQRSIYLLTATAGVVLSAASYFNWCVFEGCQTLHGTEAFGVPVSVWGVAFFSVVAFLALIPRLRGAGVVRAFLLAAALGAEVVLVRIQVQLSDYCVVCLAITLVVLVLCALELLRFRSRRVQGRMAGPGGMIGLGLAAAGFFSGYMAAGPVWTAIMPPVDYDRDQVRLELSKIPAIGPEGSWPVVRIYSDYLCPFCRKKEPEMLGVIEDYQDQARFYFLDLPTKGSASETYITMFLATLLGDNDDAKILAARERLFFLADAQEGSASMLVSSLRSMGVAMLTESEPIETVYGAMLQMARIDGVTSTPTVIVEDRLGRRTVFKGRFEIADLVQAIEAAN
jgi:protein-disulfide isomerase/uncharacterized membrane protein